MRLKLVCHAGRDHFPPPIADLFELLRKPNGNSTSYWPIVADFMREVLVDETDDEEKREAEWRRRFEDIAQRHILTDASSKEELWNALRAVYSLKLPEGKDPRGRFLEYVVYMTLPYEVEEPGQREYECTIHEDLGGRTRPVVRSNATFDAGFLNDCAFEGHECKANLWNFLYDDKRPISVEAERKLRYMESVVEVVRESGRECRMFFVTLRSHATDVVKRLASAGFNTVEVLTSADIERRLIA